MMKFSSYSECVNFLFSLERAGIKYDLKNITSLLHFLDNPQGKFKSIHIAGTNGKGSVAAIINSILIESGFKTGLFTSPHLIDLRERFLVNGKYISKKFIISYTEKMYQQILKIKPSFFEVTTALAFDYFSEKKVDYAVIETGLGGRLDSTNIIIPDISIITGIGIEHTEYLGKTIESITREKGGIIKNNIPVIAGKMPVTSQKILKKISLKKKSEIIFANKISGCKITKRDKEGFLFDYNLNLDGESLLGKTLNLKNIRFPVIGDFQSENIKTSLAALLKLNLKLNKEIILSGFKNLNQNSKLHCRFEVINKNPFIIVDVSHNEQGMKNIKSNLEYFDYNDLYIIFGMMEDKDYESCINELKKLGGEIIITKPENKKAASPEMIYAKSKIQKSVLIKENIRQSYSYVRSKINKNDLLLVTGSFYVAGDFLKVIKHNFLSSS